MPVQGSSTWARLQSNHKPSMSGTGPRGGVTGEQTVDLTCPMPLCVAVAHSTPDVREQVELFQSRRIGIGTAIRNVSRDAIDGHASRDLRVLERLASEGGVAVVTLCEMRWLGLVRPQPAPARTANGLYTVQVAEWCELPPFLREINSKGMTIVELRGDEAERVIDAARSMHWM